MRKNVKALSPVVASIILIAVTVAVSIVVAAWMGALTFTFTATTPTEQRLKAEGFSLVWASTSGNTVRYYNLTDFISVAHSFNVTTLYFNNGLFSFVHGDRRYVYQ
jgi:flagellin-like protein